MDLATPTGAITVGETVAPLREVIGDRRGTGLHRITDRTLIRTVRAANGPFKRAFDLIASVCGLIVLIPLLAPIALLCAVFNRGPIFFGHTRVGRHGRLFTCWKFQTMIKNGDQVLKAYLAAHPEAQAEWDETQKLENDPRVTLIGRFLRSTSLDELPQLWNVVRGEMSLVGPRPITRAELDRYGKDRKYYLLVRPGITGLWQVSGRSRTGYARRISLDKKYVQVWSFFGDLDILLRTVGVLLKRDGAY
jgi:Undecaprenyl-phosphate galactose phosphotransferase WbaP